MKDWKVPAFILAATAAALGGMLPPATKGTKAEVSQGAPGASPKTAERPSDRADTGEAASGTQGDLFDPRLIAGSICRGKNARTAPDKGAPQAVRLLLASRQMAEAAKGDGPVMPLLEGLGNLSIRITTGRPDAQRYFDQGLRLAYGFNHADAVRSFRQAQKIDPGCALCFWGEAWALGPNVNVPMLPEALQPAADAMAAARALASGASAKEQALIAALDARYFDPSDADPSDQEDPGRAMLDRDFANAMGAVHRRFPDDDNIAAIFAESMMLLSPWDYWEADARTPKGRTREVIALLEQVLERNPDHAAAIHLFIHIVEASDTPERAEKYADRLGALMPAAGHIVHMPAHIYIRVGRYLDSVRVNQAAIEADEALIEKLESNGIYPMVYYPHNIHFVMTSAQMAGAKEIALKAAHKLDAALPMEAAQALPLVQPIKAAPILATAQFGSAGDILALPDPGGSVPFIKAMWHYARGLGWVMRNDLASARAEVAAIEAINAGMDHTKLIEYAVPGPEVLALARHVLQGKIALAAGNHQDAVDSFTSGVEIQSGLPYMEPPYWYYPINQSLGAALLQSGRPEDAERAFKAALFEAPNNGWALYGLRETYKAMGDMPAAAEMNRLFKAAWAGDPESLQLSSL